MVAASVMSFSAQGVFYLIATVLFVVAAVAAWLVAPRNVWGVAVALGLALGTFVMCYNAFALS